MADAFFSGENRPYGALISYWINPSEEESEDETKKKEAIIEILDASDNVLRTLKGPAKPGLNRTTWALNKKGIRLSMNPFQEPTENENEPGGVSVRPGTYTVRVSYQDAQSETKIDVIMDPRISIDEASIQAQMAMYEQWQADAVAGSKAVAQLRDALSSVDLVNARLKNRKDEEADSLRALSKDVKETLTALGEQFVGKQVQGIRRDPNTVSSLLFTASGYINTGFDAPNQSAQIAYEQARERLNQVLEEINGFFAADWDAYKRAVLQANVDLFSEREPIELR